MDPPEWWKEVAVQNDTKVDCEIYEWTYDGAAPAFPDDGPRSFAFVVQQRLEVWRSRVHSIKINGVTHYYVQLEDGKERRLYFTKEQIALVL